MAGGLAHTTAAGGVRDGAGGGAAASTCMPRSSMVSRPSSRQLTVAHISQRLLPQAPMLTQQQLAPSPLMPTTKYHSRPQSCSSQLLTLPAAEEAGAGIRAAAAAAATGM